MRQGASSPLRQWPIGSRRTPDTRAPSKSPTFRRTRARSAFGRAPRRAFHFPRATNFDWMSADQVSSSFFRSSRTRWSSPDIALPSGSGSRPDIARGGHPPLLCLGDDLFEARVDLRHETVESLNQRCVIRVHVTPLCRLRAYETGRRRNSLAPASRESAAEERRCSCRGGSPATPTSRRPTSASPRSPVAFWKIDPSAPPSAERAETQVPLRLFVSEARRPVPSGRRALGVERRLRHLEVPTHSHRDDAQHFTHRLDPRRSEPSAGDAETVVRVQRTPRGTHARSSTHARVLLERDVELFEDAHDLKREVLVVPGLIAHVLLLELLRLLVVLVELAEVSRHLREPPRRGHRVVGHQSCRSAASRALTSCPVFAQAPIALPPRTFSRTGSAPTRPPAPTERHAGRRCPCGGKLPLAGAHERLRIDRSNRAGRVLRHPVDQTFCARSHPG